MTDHQAPPTPYGQPDPDVRELAALVAAQAAELATLRQRIEAQDRALAALVGREAGTAGQDDTEVGRTSDATSPAAGDRIARRQLLRRAGAAAGAAAAGGAALSLASASPAAAVTASGSGNPGGLFTGVGGDGVYASTDTALSAGLYGSSSASGGRGVHGLYAGPGAGTAILAVSNELFGSVGLDAIANIGVMGTTAGTQTDSAGVLGINAGGGIGVLATATNGGNALRAEAPTGVAMRAIGSHALVTKGTETQLWLDGTAPSPAGSPIGQRGQMVVDPDGALWFCTTSAPDTRWVKLSGASTAGQLHVLPSTVRIYDSRPTDPPLTVAKGVLANAAERTIDASLGGTAIPAEGATAAMVNLTVTATTNPGFVALFKNGIPYPGTSSINWTATGTTIANLAVVALDDALQFTARAADNCSAHVVVDLIGYYR